MSYFVFKLYVVVCCEVECVFILFFFFYLNNLKVLLNPKQKIQIFCGNLKP